MEDYPKGLPRLACFLDSDDAFMVYKRFGIVFARLLLNKQSEIREMQADLEAMDRTDDSKGGTRYLKSREEDIQRDSQTIPYKSLGTRPQLMQSLEKKILEYCNLLVFP